MNTQVFKLCSAYQIRYGSIYFSRPLTSVIVCQRFRHLGHNRCHMAKLSSPRKVFEDFKSIQVYSTDNTPQTKNKDQTENILTVPNILTVGRMLMCPVLGYLVIHNDYPTAFGLFIAAGITDLVCILGYFKVWCEYKLFLAA